MDTLPGMWRDELWHPKLVHFPVALLILGAVVYVVSVALSEKAMGEKLHFAARLMVVVGAAGAWVAVYTGTLADSAVARSLCDPLVAEEHEYYGFLLAYLATGAVLVDSSLQFLKGKRAYRWVHASVAVVLLACAGVTAHVGHLGGKLVFQQGAAVHHPSEDCSEFVP